MFQILLGSPWKEKKRIKYRCGQRWPFGVETQLNLSTKFQRQNNTQSSRAGAADPMFNTNFVFEGNEEREKDTGGAREGIPSSHHGNLFVRNLATFLINFCYVSNKPEER
ncbi:hypothetical protein TNCV_4355371 [Trichonephila clavipes]|nr:hypothetical protein TNCV_4355371 [Trichonephila clavipes]